MEYVGQNGHGDGYIFEPTSKFVEVVSKFPATEEQINSQGSTYKAGDNPIVFGIAKVNARL